MDEAIRNYMKELGKKGGLARAANHSKKELSSFGLKGGRPKKVIAPDQIQPE